MMGAAFWRGKPVPVTDHTCFKRGWLAPETARVWMLCEAEIAAHEVQK